MVTQEKMTELAASKILLVDDKPENHTALESIFEEDIYSFTSAYTGNDALKILLNEDDFALILMDVKMPGMNGFETASLIYKREKLAHIPIIFITSNDGSEENLFKSYLSGGVDYIVKPINPDLLKIKVRIFIELYKKNRELILQKQKLDKINNDLKTEIKEKLKIEKELREKNIQLSVAQKLSRIGNWDWNLLTNTITGSEEIYNIYELDAKKEKFNIENILEKTHPADIEYVKSKIAESISEKKSFNLTFRIIPGKGKLKFINKKGRIIVDERNEAAKIYGITQDITDLKKTEEQLKIFALFEKMLSEIYIFRQKDLSLLYANEDALRNIGCGISELKSKKLNNILKDFEKDEFKKITAPLIKGKREKVVFFSNICRKDGSFYPVEIHLQLIKQNEGWDTFPSFSHNVFLAVVLDLSERKRTETELATSLKEKELLIKEIHHRVKNNLQVISSLLNLQKSYTKNIHINHIIDESRDRIRSMALLHEKLYQSKNLSRINIKSYIEELAANLIDTYSNPEKDIELEINSLNENISIDLGISLGLIINEFISNSIKHGFKELSEGKISVLFKRLNGNNFYLSVKDNGSGLPDNFKVEETKTLGLQLVKSLVQQINGNLTTNRNGGTEFKVIYSVEEGF